MGEISTFGLELFSSSQIFYKGRARFINLPATDGGHTFLPHHENVIIALVPGTTKIVTEPARRSRLLQAPALPR